MEFKQTPPEWTVKGVQPPDEIAKEKGWLAGYKPPASYFNWFFNKCYECLKELQEKLTGIETTHNNDVKTINTALGTKAPIASPSLTGTPKAPTAAAGTNTTQIATTAFVTSAISKIDLSPLQEHTEYVVNANLNTLLDDKAYICSGTLLNAPISNTYCIVRAYDTDATNRVLQVVWVPQTDNTVRQFMRTAVNGTTFGAWREIATTKYVTEGLEQLNLLVSENKFRSDLIVQAMNKAILMLFIETFETTDDIDTSRGDGATAISNYYNATTHVLDKTDTGTVNIYFTPKIVTNGNNSIWGYVDWQDVAGGSVTLAISRDNGVTYTEVAHNTLVSISSKPTGVSMICRLTLTGKLKFRNLAWGTK